MSTCKLPTMTIQTRPLAHVSVRLSDSLSLSLCLAISIYLSCAHCSLSFSLSLSLSLLLFSAPYFASYSSIAPHCFHACHLPFKPVVNSSSRISYQITSRGSGLTFSSSLHTTHHTPPHHVLNQTIYTRDPAQSK
jgi:hypothetical protein